MNRGVAAQPIVRDDADRRKLLDVVGRSLDGCEASVHAYCVMTNHYHLLVEAGATELAQLMKRIGQRYSQWFNKRHGRIGPVFAGRYHDVSIDSDPQLLTSVRYIALNPVAIDRYDIDRYAWSSHGALVSGTAPEWLGDVVVEQFGGLGEYRRFVDSGRSSAEQIVEVVRIATDEMRGLRETRERDVRDVALLLADRVDADLARSLLDELGFAPGNNERTARHRARRRFDELGPVVERVRTVLEYQGSGDRR